MVFQEMFDVIDFNRNRELDWREWHNFISKEVHAGEAVHTVEENELWQATNSGAAVVLSRAESLSLIFLITCHPARLP